MVETKKRTFVTDA